VLEPEPFKLGVVGAEHVVAFTHGRGPYRTRSHSGKARLNCGGYHSSRAAGVAVEPSRLNRGRVAALSQTTNAPGPRRGAAAGQLEVEIWSEGAYLRLCVRGRYDPPSGLALLSLIPVEAQHFACRHVLVDIRGVIGEGSTLSRFEMGATAARLLPPLRVAIVWRAETTDRFAETVALNRGANLRVFASEPEALAWLLDGVTP
jgi:hypothetical protein